MTETLFFPAASRALIQSSEFREFSLGPSLLQDSFRAHFPEFISIKDLTLAAHYTHLVESSGANAMLLIPVVGSVAIRQGSSENDLYPGQCVLLFREEKKSISLIHSDDDELSSHIEIYLNLHANTKEVYSVYDLNLEQDNQLKKIKFNTELSISIGRYQGRQDGLLAVNSETSIVVYAVNGVFEFANRLLEKGDILAMYGLIGTLDFEALVEESILMILQRTD